MRPLTQAAPEGAPQRRLVVAAPIDPDGGDELQRVSWPRTILRLALQPGAHPWQRGWQVRNRTPLLALAAAVALLLLFAASGCASGPLVSVSRDAQVPRPGSGARCDSLIVSRELAVPAEGEVGEFRVTLRDLPEVVGPLHVLVRQPRFPAALDLDGPASFDKVTEAAADARELTLVLSRPRRAASDWPRSSCKSCRVEVELTGLFGAREGLDDFFRRALQEASAIDRAFAQQSAQPSSPSALHEAGARLVAEGHRCGVQLDGVVEAIYGALAKLDEARAALYGGDAPRLPDPAAVARAFREASASIEAVPVAAAALRGSRWSAALNMDGPLRSAMLHLHLALQAQKLAPEHRDAAARWIVLATAPDEGAIARRSADLPLIRDLRDAEARLAWVDARAGAELPLPGLSPATLNVPWFQAVPHGRKCIGADGAVPVRDRAAESASVAAMLGGKLRINRIGDLATASVTLSRARELLCDPLHPDVEALFSGLEDRELGPAAERLETIFAEVDPRGTDELARALTARASRVVCRLLSPDTVQRRVTSVVGYKIFVEGGTRILDLLPGPLVCDGRALAPREVRGELREAYRAALDAHAQADRLCPMRGGKCPDEVAASVRRLFGLRAPELSQPAAPESKALDFPPAFGFSDAWVEKLGKCGRESCDALSRLRAAAPPGQFEGAVCAPPAENDPHPQDITLDRPEAPASVTLSSCDAHAGVRLTLRRKPEAGTLVSIASAHPFRYGSEAVTRQGRNPQLGRIFERVADLGDSSDVISRPDGAFEVALTPTVENQVFWFFTLRRRDY